MLAQEYSKTSCLEFMDRSRLIYVVFAVDEASGELFHLFTDAVLEVGLHRVLAIVVVLLLLSKFSKVI